VPFIESSIAINSFADLRSFRSVRASIFVNVTISRKARDKIVSPCGKGLRRIIFIYRFCLFILLERTGRRVNRLSNNHNLFFYGSSCTVCSHAVSSLSVLFRNSYFGHEKRINSYNQQLMVFDCWKEFS